MTESGRPPVTGYRWTILALLFAATTINYLDRQVLGILAPTLQRDFGWTDTDYGSIASWFSLTYGIGMLGMGRLLDWLGARRGLSLAVIVWSLAAMGHALARSVSQFSTARAVLGLGESGNFPGCFKTVAQWFPTKERALAAGLINAGTNMGAIAAPAAVPWIALTWGWRWAFVATGAIGFMWLGAWLLLYRDPEGERRTAAAESISWFRLLSHRQTWAFAVGKGLTDPVWFFYLFWLPKFLDSNFGVKLGGLALPLVAIYVFADVGSVTGGWLSGALIHRGWTVNRARKGAMLAAALLIVPTMTAPSLTSMWGAVAIVSLAAGAHQWWSSNLFTTVTDMFPSRAVASVVGIGGFAGSMASAMVQRGIGRVLDATNSNYTPIFMVCGLAYVVTWVLIHFLVPRLEPVSAGAVEPAR
jgi:ACS family hexuronate transporter-like MFS transporter